MMMGPGSSTSTFSCQWLWLSCSSGDKGVPIAAYNRLSERLITFLSTFASFGVTRDESARRNFNATERKSNVPSEREDAQASKSHSFVATNCGHSKHQGNSHCIKTASSHPFPSAAPIPTSPRRPPQLTRLFQERGSRPHSFITRTRKQPATMPSGDHSQAFHRASLSPPALNGGSFSAMMAAQHAQKTGSAAAMAVHGGQQQPSVSPSTSPSNLTNATASAAGANGSGGFGVRQRSISIPGSRTAPKLLTPFLLGDIKILLLENVSQGAVQMLREQGYQVDFHTKAWSEEELVEKIGEYNVIGIRSKTKLTARVIKAAQKVSFVCPIPSLSFSCLLGDSWLTAHPLTPVDSS